MTTKNKIMKVIFEGTTIKAGEMINILQKYPLNCPIYYTINGMIKTLQISEFCNNSGLYCAPINLTIGNKIDEEYDLRN